MLVELDEEHTKCGICVTKFSSDRDNKDPEIRKHLPVLSSSQRCDHWFCHGCILREQLRVAEDNNGRIPKWIKCMHCREKTSFNPAEPKYHRLLIDLLARAQKYAAAQVKNEEQESCVDMQLDLGSSNTMCMKRECDAVDDEDEREMKRPKLLAPSPQLVQVKEEPVESDDHYDPPPLVDSASPMSEMSQSATTADANDEPRSLVCSKCKVLKERRCFTGRSRKKGDAAVCKECNLNDHRTIRKMKEALNAAMEELEKMKSANGNIANAAKAEGLGDSIENNGDRTAQLTRAFRNEALPYPRPRNNEPQIICSTCKVAKFLSHYSKIQRNQGEAASCEKCVSKEAKAALKGSTKEHQILLCSTCKLEKKVDCFPKKPLIQGAAVNCLKCLNKEAKVSLKSSTEEPQMLLCSTCNDAKKLDCFSKMQREKGAAASCEKCINWFQPREYFQRGKDANEAKSTLTSSTEEQQHLLLCCTCKLARRFDCFAKKQRKQGAAASCEKCINPTKLRCSICKEAKRLDCFSTMQRKQGAAARCRKCFNKEAKVAMKSSEESQILRCSLAKKEKRLTVFRRSNESREKLIIV